jgi:N-acetylmuramoyl-L-alanine amidase
MRIKNHRLFFDDDKQVPFVATNNKGEVIEPKYLIMHYTATPSAQSAINWFKNPQSKASAHIVISREGEITQMVPFNQRAWHAGVSEWNNLSGLNAHSIGIELENAGKLTRITPQHWVAWFGGMYTDDHVMVARHKNEHADAGWHVYTQKQILTAVDVAIAIINRYNLVDVLGHDDISPGRKVDPGPAFPMMSFRSKVMGRSDDAPPLFETTTALNIRSGPGINYQRLEFSPLKEGTRVEVLNTFDVWKYVQVVNHPLQSEARGWVHGKYLQELDFIY